MQVKVHSSKPQENDRTLTTNQNLHLKLAKNCNALTQWAPKAHFKMATKVQQTFYLFNEGQFSWKKATFYVFHCKEMVKNQERLYFSITILYFMIV